MRRLATGLRHQTIDAELDVGIEFRFRSASLNGGDQIGTDLLHDRGARTTLADFFRKDERGDGPHGSKHGDHVGVVFLRILRRADGPRRLRRCFHRRRDDAEHVVALPFGLRQPVLLQGTGGDTGCRIAAEQHQLAATLEQGFHRRPCEVDHLVGRAVPIGRIAMIAEIEKIDVRKPFDECPKHRQSAVARIEDADHTWDVPCKRAGWQGCAGSALQWAADDNSNAVSAVFQSPREGAGGQLRPHAGRREGKSISWPDGQPTVQ